MDQNKFFCFCDCFEEAFRKLVSEATELEFIRCDEDETATEEKRLSAVVGVVGINKGRVYIGVNEQLAQKLYESMNGEPAEDEMELYLYLAEFTNMITGNGVTVLNNTYKGSNLRLTPPAIFAGDNLDITTPKVQLASRCYKTKYGNVRLEIGFEGV